MPRLRSQTRITGVLPRELLQRSLEFLACREVHEVAKNISREFLSTARRALTRGRWRPMARFSDEAGEHIFRFEHRGCAVETETFKAVWALEPGEVMFELAHWDDEDEYDALNAMDFLKIVEPNIEGLSRIVAACEYAQEIYDEAYGGDMKIVTRVGSWAHSLGHQLRLGYPAEYGDDRLPVLDRETEDRLFALGLESWTDPKLAASFVRDVLEYDGYFEDEGPYDALAEDSGWRWESIEPSYRQMHERLARDWRDRDRAGAFVTECVRLQAEPALDMEAAIFAHL